MNTHIVYFDETGDDGNNTSSSRIFLLTSVSMDSNNWKSNYSIIKELRKELKADFGMYIKEEMHTKYFVRDKDPYRKYEWSKEERLEILRRYAKAISNLNIKAINVLIDKTVIKSKGYNVLDSALRYSIQRIENSSDGKWNYLIITDKGRTEAMRKTARAMQIYNPINSFFYSSNNPIKCMIEDILEKDSKDSSFIQVADFISFFFYLYHLTVIQKEPIPKRIESLVNSTFIKEIISTFVSGDILNNQASRDNDLGLVIYPKP